jgi:hypothetical protein
MMTIEELALTVIELTPEDEQSLRAFAEVETAAFQEYLSEYQTEAAVRMVCKGCHGG